MSFVLLCSHAARADVPSELERRPIVAIEVEGIAPETPLPELGLELGTPLDRSVVRELLVRLLAGGRFSDAQVDAEPRDGGVALRVRVQPRIVVTRIEVRGTSALDRSLVVQAIRLEEGDEIDPVSLGTIESAVRALYAERGFTDAAITASLSSTDDPSRKLLRIEVSEGEPLRIAEIRWVGRRGSERMSRGLAALGISVGDVLDRTRLDEGIRAAQSALRDDGWLEARIDEPTIETVEERAIVTIPLRMGRHWRVFVEGYRPLELGQVIEVLRLDEEPLTEAAVASIEGRIVDLYRRHGFADVEVRGERTTDPARPDPLAARLFILIEPGVQLRVTGVSFPGADHFGTGFLRDQVVSYLEEDIPTPELFEVVDSEVVDRIGLGGSRRLEARQVPADVEVVPEQIWFPPTYDEAVAHIAELYQAAGFLDARAGPPELRRLSEDRAVVVIPVYEGARTLVYDVRVLGNDVVSSREILEAAGIDRGDAFGYLPLEEARRRVLELYAERGHLFTRVEPTVRFSENRQRAEILLEVVERYPVALGAIRVIGNRLTDEGVIRDVIGLRPGQLLRPSELRDAEDRLLSLGVFGTVQIAPADPDLPEQVKPLVVTVSERTTQHVGLSAGISSGEGARGTFEYAYRDLLGLAIAFSLRVTLAYQFIFQDTELEGAITPLSLLDRLERRVVANITVPWLPGVANTRASLDLSHIRDNERDFGYDKNGLALTFTWVPERGLTFAISGEVEHNNVSLFIGQRCAGMGMPDPTRPCSYRDIIDQAIRNGDTRTQRLLRVPEGQSAIASARVNWSWDLRDNPFNPTRGILASASAEYAHTLVTEQINPMLAPFLSNFLKVNLSLSGYVPLAEGWVLAMQGRFGSVIHLEDGSLTYPNRAYYLGGVDSLRGFLQDQVVPEDQSRLIRENAVDPALIVRTGDIYYLTRLELRFPIVDQFQGGIFADVGNVWATVASFDLLTPRWNAGLGLRIATPVGPIALDYGFNLDRRTNPNEPFGSLHFSIGLF